MKVINVSVLHQRSKLSEGLRWYSCRNRFSQFCSLDLIFRKELAQLNAYGNDKKILKDDMYLLNLTSIPFVGIHSTLKCKSVPNML